jgi:hypothetical protein
MAHLNSTLADVNVGHTSDLHAVGRTGGEKAPVSKANDTVYRVAATMGAILLLLTVVWAG